MHQVLHARVPQENETAEGSVSDSFEVTWEADDGYCGGSRPHHFNIHAGDIEDGMAEQQLEDFFWDAIMDDFRDKVSPYSSEKDEFIEWAKAVQAERKAVE